MARQVYPIDVGTVNFLSGANRQPVIGAGTRNPIAITWATNFMPTPTGISSVSPNTLVSRSIAVDEVWNAKDTTAGLVAYLFREPETAGNAVYAASGLATAATLVGGAYGHITSHALVRDTSYFWDITNEVILTYSSSTNNFSTFATTGLPVSGILGITAAGTYLIAYTKDAVYWSSPVNPSDFTPSLVTGAGFTIPTGLRGEIMACHPTTWGFIVYSDECTITAALSGNSQYPWIFRVVGGTGLPTRESASHGDIAAMGVAYTGNGFIAISATEATSILPELGEAVANGRLWNLLPEGELQAVVGTELASVLAAPLTIATGDSATALDYLQVDSTLTVDGTLVIASTRVPVVRWVRIVAGIYVIVGISYTAETAQKLVIYNMQLKKYGAVDVSCAEIIPVAANGSPFHIVTASGSVLDCAANALPDTGARLRLEYIRSTIDSVSTFLGGRLIAMAPSAAVVLHEANADMVQVAGTALTVDATVASVVSFPARITSKSHTLDITLCTRELRAGELEFTQAGKF